MKTIYSILILLIINNISFGQEIPFELPKEIGKIKFGMPNSIYVDSEKNIFVSGIFLDSMRLGNTKIISKGGFDIYIIKYNMRGEYIWHKTFGKYTHDSWPKISIDSNDDIILAGQFAESINVNGSSIELGGASVIKMDKNGNILWGKSTRGNSGNIFHDVSVDIDNNILLTGNYNGTINLCDTTITSVGDNDMLVAKLKPNGEKVFIKSYGTHDDDYGYSIKTDKDKSIIIGGGFERGNIQLEDTVFTNYAGDFEYLDVIIMKLDSLGDFTWAKHYGGSNHDQIFDLEVDNLSNIYITGCFYGTVKFEDSTFVSHSSGGNSHTSFFLLKLNTDGHFNWAKALYHSYYSNESCVQIDEHGYVYLAVTYQDGSVYSNDFVINSSGNQDCSIIKFDSFGNYIWDIFPVSNGNETIFDLHMNNNNLWCCGTITEPTYFGNISLSSNSNSFFVKIPGFTANPGNDTIICRNQSIQLGADLTGYNGFPPYSYLWIPNINLSSNTDPNPTATPLNSINYKLIVTDRLGYTAMDSIIIHVDTVKPQNIILPNDTLICNGANLSLVLPYDFYYDYFWSNGSNEPEIIVNETGKYKVDVSNACGVASDSINVEVVLPRDLFIGNDTIMNAGDTLLLDVGEGFINYLWYDGSSNPYYLIDSTNYQLGVNYYYITVTDSNSCQNSDTIKITVLDSSVSLWPMSPDDQVSIYPNPCSNYLYLKLDNAYANSFKIYLFNINGKMIYENNYPSGKIVEVNISDFERGLYILKLAINDKSIIFYKILME